MNHYTISFFLSSSLYSGIETARHLVRSDFFAKIYTNFEIRRRVPRVKKSGEIQKEHMHPSLSLSTCRSADGMFTLMFANTV